MSEHGMCFPMLEILYNSTKDLVIYNFLTIWLHEGQLGAFRVDAIQTPTPLRGGSSIPLRFDPFSFGKRHYNFLDIQKGVLSCSYKSVSKKLVDINSSLRLDDI